MSATILSTDTTVGHSGTHAVRLVLIALAIVALLAVSFALGRANVTTTKAPTVAPIAAPIASPSSVDPCRMGRAC